MQVGDITHRRNRQGHIELDQGGLRVSAGPFESGQPSLPPFTVIVDLVQALLSGILEQRNHLERLRCRSSAPDPTEPVSSFLVEFLRRSAVVRKVRPLEVFKTPALHDAPKLLFPRSAQRLGHTLRTRRFFCRTSEGETRPVHTEASRPTHRYTAKPLPLLVVIGFTHVVRNRLAARRLQESRHFLVHSARCSRQPAGTRAPSCESGSRRPATGIPRRRVAYCWPRCGSCAPRIVDHTRKMESDSCGYRLG